VSQKVKSEETHLQETRRKILAAAVHHVPFDGWSKACFDAAISDSGVSADMGRLAFPRGPVDLALAFHKQGDVLMEEHVPSVGLENLRYSQKVAALVRLRLEVMPDREVVRRGVVLFALPAHASDGASAIWQTCDLIWNTLGDTSDDINWYSKRTILSAVYSSTLLFWLGDESAGQQDSWEFLDRRIENVMQFEKFKAGIRSNPFAKFVERSAAPFLDRIHAPDNRSNVDLPGHVSPNQS